MTDVSTVVTTEIFDPRTIDRDAAILKYRPLVKYVVGRLNFGLSPLVEYEDLVSYGTVGLIEALDRFDASRGIKFETYAIGRIRGAIADALRTLDRFPRSVRQRLRKLEGVTRSLQAELGREPMDEQVAARMGMTTWAYRQSLVDASWKTISLDGLMERETEPGNRSEMPADPRQQNFTRRLEKQQLLEALSCAIRRLPERELQIVSLHYKDRVTMREIADVLGISQSRVCQIHARALKFLRGNFALRQAS